MEYVPGENLLQVIKNKKFNYYTEKDAADIMKCLMKTASFLHQKNIIHRDIKPERILFAITGKYDTLKLIDFALSINEESEAIRIKQQTNIYMSPEAYKRKFSKKSDSWAIGIILYEMLTQKLPYNATGHELTKLIKKGEYNIKQLQNTLSISKESKSLINALLTVDEDKRISVDDALNSKWLKKFEDDVKTINNNITRYFENNDIVNNLRNFNKFSNFKKEILFYIAKTSVEDEIIELKKDLS